MSGIKELAKCQRRIALRVASAYRSVSADAVLVIAGIPPIDLLAKERLDLFNQKQSGSQRDTDRSKLLDAWQYRWEASTKGRWTAQLIPDLRPWFRRSFGEINFHINRALSGHVCFSSYLRRIGKLASPVCWYCDAPLDDAHHTLFICDAWYGRRSSLNATLGCDISPQSLVPLMLRSRGQWSVISEYIVSVMKLKESEERRRQANPP